MSDIESISADDIAQIREVGSKIIRNISLFMDNPFSYAHLVSITEQDVAILDQIKRRCGLTGDGLVPAQPIGQSQPPDLRHALLDAGFARLRSVVDDILAPGGVNDE